MILERVQLLENAIRTWLESEDLTKAICDTIEGGYFPKSDVMHAVDHLLNVVKLGELSSWAEINSNFDKTDQSGYSVLCLHAGNLPLVGLQDALAAIVSGAHYLGKISKKDPFLMSSLMEYIKSSHPCFLDNITYSTDLLNFSGFEADYWLFAGAESSLSDIKYTLESGRIIKKNAQSLIRLAHFSVALIHEKIDKSVLVDLVESVLRYQGKGCRSVALIYSDIPLIELGDELEALGKVWLQENELKYDPDKILKWKYAYNSSIGVEQVWVGNALVQEGTPTIGHNLHVHWRPLKYFNNDVLIYGNGIQQVYYMQQDSLEGLELFSDKKDYIDKAQTPSIFWKPDGIDPLNWILTH